MRDMYCWVSHVQRSSAAICSGASRPNSPVCMYTSFCGFIYCSGYVCCIRHDAGRCACADHHRSHISYHSISGHTIRVGVYRYGHIWCLHIYYDQKHHVLLAVLWFICICICFCRHAVRQGLSQSVSPCAEIVIRCLIGRYYSEFMVYGGIFSLIVYLSSILHLSSYVSMIVCRWLTRAWPTSGIQGIYICIECTLQDMFIPGDYSLIYWSCIIPGQCARLPMRTFRSSYVIYLWSYG